MNMEITVAQATPAIPIPNTKIKMGSKIIFKAAPMSMVYIAF